MKDFLRIELTVDGADGKTEAPPGLASGACAAPKRDTRGWSPSARRRWCRAESRGQSSVSPSELQACFPR